MFRKHLYMEERVRGKKVMEVDVGKADYGELIHINFCRKKMRRWGKDTQTF